MSMRRGALPTAAATLALLLAACGDAAVTTTEPTVPPAATTAPPVTGGTTTDTATTSALGATTSVPAADETPPTTRAERGEVRGTAPPKVAETVPPTTVPPTGFVDVPPGLVEAVLADAASRGGGSATLLSSEAVTWPDGSLGCPKPGETYTQAPVSGYRLLVDAGGQTLDYRAASVSFFTLCESPVLGDSGGAPSS